MAGRSVCCRNESKTCNYREVPRVTATAHAQSSPVRGHAAPADLSAGAHVTHAHPTVAVVRLPGGLGKRRDDDRACFPPLPSHQLLLGVLHLSFDPWHLLSSPGRGLGLHVNPTP
jgi:hypothetical protein